MLIVNPFRSVETMLIGCLTQNTLVIVVEDKLSDLKDINAKKVILLQVFNNWFVGNFRGKVPIECYIRLFQSYCSTHYGLILWPSIT